MKTAEEWVDEMRSEGPLGIPKVSNLVRFRAIQLDAFKAGMTEAASLVGSMPANRARCEVLNLPLQAWEEGLEAAERAILKARDAKVSL